jgi:hypothetical protein
VSEIAIALRRIRRNRASSSTRRNRVTATTTIAPSVACGRSSNSGARNAPVSSTSSAAAIDASCDFPPAPSAAAVWLAPPDWTKPDERPASRLDPPSATRSRLTSNRSPWSVARDRATPMPSALTSRTPNAAPIRSTTSPARTSGSPGSGSADGSSPTTSTPWSFRSRRADAPIARISTSRVAGKRGTSRGPSSSTATLAAPTATVAPSTSPRSPSSVQARSKKSPSPVNPVITGLETRSATAPRRNRPASAATIAVTIASVAGRAAKRAASPCASGPTAAAETAAVAVVALTTSERDVPSSA